MKSNTKSGIQNINWSERDKSWAVKMRRDGVLIRLGSYKSLEEAKEVLENPSLYVPVDEEIKNKNPLIQEDVRYLFDYTEDGNLINKVKRSGKSKIGERIGNYDPNGYLFVCINKKFYKVHRLIWIWHKGDIDPKKSIDHINHNPSDNRIENLRLVEHITNGHNLKRCKRNKSGCTGVNFDKRKLRWRSRIFVDGKEIGLGYYIEKEKAIKARKEAEIKYGFHPNHGKTREEINNG